MTKNEVMQMALDALNRAKRNHYYCEDRFYSCPKHEEGCANDLDGDECTCGADSVNETIDTAIKALCAALAQPEPVASVTVSHYKGLANRDMDYWGNLPDGTYRLYTAQREWVGLTDEDIAEAIGAEPDDIYLADFRKVEAKLKEKNT